jgi:hypothetical protein
MPLLPPLTHDPDIGRPALRALVIDGPDEVRFGFGSALSSGGG